MVKLPLQILLSASLGYVKGRQPTGAAFSPSWHLQRGKLHCPMAFKGTGGRRPRAYAEAMQWCPAPPAGGLPAPPSARWWRGAYLGMYPASSPSWRSNSRQAWLGPVGLPSAAPTRPSKASPPPSSWRAWPSISPSASFQGRCCLRRRVAPRKPRANSAKVMAPSRSVSRRWKIASASAGRTRSSAHSEPKSSRSMRPEPLRSQETKSERSRARSSRSARPPSGEPMTRGAGRSEERSRAGPRMSARARDPAPGTGDSRGCQVRCHPCGISPNLPAPSRRARLRGPPLAPPLIEETSKPRQQPAARRRRRQWLCNSCPESLGSSEELRCANESARPGRGRSPGPPPGRLPCGHRCSAVSQVVLGLEGGGVRGKPA